MPVEKRRCHCGAPMGMKNTQCPACGVKENPQEDVADLLERIIIMGGFVLKRVEDGVIPLGTLKEPCQKIHEMSSALVRSVSLIDRMDR